MVKQSGSSEVSKEIRDRILAAAGKCFRRLGIRRTSIDEIARVAGISRRTVYNYFDDKSSLVAEIFVAEMRRVGGQATRQLDISLEPAELLVEAELILLDCAAKSPYYELFVGQEAVKLTSEVFGHSTRFVAALKEYWDPIFDVLEERSALRADFDRLEAVGWLNRMNLLIAGPAKVDDDRDTVRQLLLRYLAPAFLRG